MYVCTHAYVQPVQQTKEKRKKRERVRDVLPRS